MARSLQSGKRITVQSKPSASSPKTLTVKVQRGDTRPIKMYVNVKPADTRPRVMTIRVLRENLELTQPKFAKLLPVSVRTLVTLEQGAEPTEGVARRVNELRRLTLALSEVIRSDSIGHWLQAPNEAFEGLKPIEIIDRGESDRIWSMIYFLRSGAPS